jgi:long-chain acyl-CoA synthetase
VADAIGRHQATLVYGSPLHFSWLAAMHDAARLPSLRLAISTTASLDSNTAVRFLTAYGLPVTQALGIIEVGLPFINISFPDRTDAVGRVLPAYRLRLEAVGQEPNLGEVLLAGPGMLDAYYHPWRPRAEILAGGWFRTGDIGELDSDGCLHLRGRHKDTINVAGMKVFPQEVEAILASHPALAGACVFGVADTRLGESPHAKVMLRASVTPAPTEQELFEFCRKRLADFKIPRHFEFVTQLQRTANGKLLHRKTEPQEAPR